MIDLKKLEITDKALIKKYMSQYENFFIPASEHDTFDKEVLDTDMFHNSSQVVGQRHPIEVAINENDKTELSDQFHIHLRVIDGRHRYRQSKKHNKQWITKFYKVDDYQQYMKLRGHFDSKKTVTSNERVNYFNSLANYYERLLNIPAHEICKKIIEDYSPTPCSESTIRKYLNYKYKDNSKIHKNMSPRKHSIREIQKKSPNTIRAEYSSYKKRILELSEQIKAYEVQLGMIKSDKPLYVIEKLNGTFWTYVSVTDSNNVAIKRLKSLNERHRIRKIQQTYEFIYPDSELLVGV